jgi:hypothetical protein
MGVMGGVGEAGQQYFANEQKAENQRSLLNTQAELERNKLEFAQSLTDKARTDQVARVDTARKGIVGEEIDAKYKGAAPADSSTWTPEQQAAVDQSKDVDRTALMKDEKISRRAAERTGDITPKDSALLDNKEGILAAQGERNKLIFEASMAKTDADFTAKMARLEVLMAKNGDKSSRDTIGMEMLKIVDSDRKEINQKLTVAQKALKDAQDPTNMMKKDEKAKVIADLNEEINSHKQEYVELGKRKQVLYKRLGFNSGDEKADTKDPLGLFK